MITIAGERIAAVLSIAAAIFMTYVAWDFPAGGDQFPIFSCAAIIFIALLMIVRTVTSPGVFDTKVRQALSLEHAKPMLLTAATVGYVVMIFELGYYTSSFLFLVIVSFAVGVRNLKVIALTAVITFPLMYAFFELFLQAALPRGILI